MKRVKLTGILAVSISIFICRSALAIDAAGLTDVIRNANILKYDKSPKVTVIGAQITTSIDPMGPPGKTSDQDLKIDALLVSKALFDAAGQEQNSCKIIFSNGGKEAKYTIISRQKVADYSSGNVNAQELLGSLALTPVVQENQPEVVAGPFYERRILVWERIDNLRKQGTGVKPFEQLYADLESSIKANDEQKAIFNKLTLLEDKLTGQEQHSAQAKKVAQGKGIHGNVVNSGRSSSGSGSGSSPSLSSASSNPQISNSEIEQNPSGFVGVVQRKIQEMEQTFQAKGDQQGVAKAKQLCSELHRCIEHKDVQGLIRGMKDVRQFAKDRGFSDFDTPFHLISGNGPNRRPGPGLGR